MQFINVACALLLFVPTAIVAQQTSAHSLLALSKRNHLLTIVDPKSLQVIARAPIGLEPHEVIVSSDGQTAYVSLCGGGDYHALSVIDLVGQKARPDIDTATSTSAMSRTV